MKLFEVEFTHNDWNDAESAGQNNHKNQFRVRIPFPVNEIYDDTNWSCNHGIIRKEFRKLHDPSDSNTKYWVRKIRRIK